jgi:hypothetical protein
MVRAHDARGDGKIEGAIMVGASLSRWTLAYFGCALFWLLAGEVLLVAGFGYPVATLAAPETLIVVHIVAIGWLSLLVCGALFQFVPVLVAGKLMSARLAAIALPVLNIGLICLVCGFAGLAGLIAAPSPALPIGGLLLLFGFCFVGISLAHTLWAARPLAMPLRFVVLGIAGLLVTALLGNVFAFALSGFIGGDWPLALLLNGVPLHAAFGLGFWLSVVAIGVSYRLFAMFLLAPDADARAMRRVLVAAGIAIILLAAGIAAIVVTQSMAQILLGLAGLSSLAAIGLYASDVARLHRTRKRRQIELNMQAALAAVAMLVLASLLLVVLLAAGQPDTHIGAVVYLFAFGWLGGLGLAKLYKIVPFITWLECYAPLLGKQPTPRVQDLVDEGRARPWFALYFLAVLAAVAILLFGWAPGFRLVALIQLVATLGLVRHFYLARRLGAVPMPQRHGVRPRLFYVNGIAREPS